MVELESKWAYGAHLIIGTLLGLVSDATEYPIDIPQRQTLYKESLPCREKAWLWFAGFLGLIGDITCWVGIDNILVDYDKPPEEQYVDAKIVYMVVGAVVMYITKTLPNHANLGLARHRSHSIVPDETSRTSVLEPSISVLPSVAWPSNSTEKCCSLGRILVAAQRVAGSLTYFTCWAGVESFYYFHGFDSPIDTEKSKGLQFLTAAIGMVFMYSAGSLAYVAFPCGASDRGAWAGIRNGESIYTSNVLRK